MKTKGYVTLALLLWAAPALAQDPEPSAGGPDIEIAEDGFSTSGAQPTVIGGYGELHLSRIAPEAGDPESEIDFHRMVLYIGKAFTDKLRFNSELELEHALTADGKPGEVALEQAFIEYELSDQQGRMGRFGVRAGIMLVPMGLVNMTHEPPVFHGVERPAVEKNIIPSTWREGGAGIYGSPVPELRYQLYVMSGLDPLGFSTGKGIRNGRQKIAEARADALAVAGRVEYEPRMAGAVVGLSGYASQAGHNIAGAYDASGMEADLGVPVVGGSADVSWRSDAIEAKALAAAFSIGDTDELAQLTDADGNMIDASAASLLFGTYAEIAYDVLSHAQTQHQLLPFIRAEYYDTQADARGAGATTDLVLGLSYRPIRQVVYKADFIHRRKNGGDNDANIVSLGAGFLY